MSQDIFKPLVALQDERLDQLGNPLVELDRLVDWGAFRPLLESARGKERKSPAGAPAKDSVMMFKGLALQSLYRLSDAQLEFQIEDRRSFQRFLGLGNHQRAPDRNTFWAFRERLSQPGLAETLFKRFSQPVGPSRIHLPQRADRRCLSGVGSRAAQHPGREPPDQAGRCAPRVDGQPAPPERHRRALDEPARQAQLRLQDPHRRRQPSQVDPQLPGCGRQRPRLAAVRGAARPGQHGRRGVGGQRLPLAGGGRDAAGGGLPEAGCGARPGRASRWARGSGWATGSAHG